MDATKAPVAAAGAAAAPQTHGASVLGVKRPRHDPNLSILPAPTSAARLRTIITTNKPPVILPQLQAANAVPGGEVYVLR